MSRVRGLIALGAALAVAIVVVTAQRRHAKEQGHLVSYGWHVDVGTVIADREPYPDPKGNGIVLPREGQFASVLNFTPLPRRIDTCMSGETAVFAATLEKLDPKSGKWTITPPYPEDACLGLPIQRRIIWPLQSFRTEPVPVAKLGYWFHKGDWVRIVALSRWNQPLSAQTRFPSQAFQVQ